METAKSNNPDRVLMGGKEYTIPEGYEAKIEDGKVIVRKKVSEDETIRKELLDFISSPDVSRMLDEEKQAKWFAWLEKQKEQSAKLPFVASGKDAYCLDKLYYLIRESEYEDDVKNYIRDFLNRNYGKQKPKKEDWNDEDSVAIKEIQTALNVTYCESHRDALAEWLDTHCNAYPLPAKLNPNRNIRWKRAKAGENLPESIILPDGDDPRFGKCAVRESYYIPISELKELPKE